MLIAVLDFGEIGGVISTLVKLMGMKGLSCLAQTLLLLSAVAEGLCRRKVWLAAVWWILWPLPVAAWMPGPANPAATGGFSVDHMDRRDVLSFYHTIYHASEEYAGRMKWSGSVAAGASGTTSEVFKNDVLRRVNFYRALVGVRADVVFDAVKSAKCQQAALMMSANNALSHTPPPMWRHFTVDGAEAAAKSNLSLGTYGPGAVDGQIRDDGGNNQAVGHRRWLLHARAREMATGDVPDVPGARAANALWVIGDFHPPASPRFIAWPNEGYVPDHLVPARWSLGHAGADFAAASVTMVRAGASVPLTVVSRVAANMAENTIVWEPVGLPPAPVPADTAYTVTVTGVVINGVPVTRTYDVTLFNPADLGEAMVIAGPATASVTGASYTFTPVRQAEGYELRVSRGVAAGWTEGAEEGVAAVVDGTSTSYALRQSEVKRSGARAFHLTFPTVSDSLQWFALDRVLVPGATAEVRFHDLFRYVTTGSRLSVEVSTDGGLNWYEVWGRSGNGSNSSAGWDASFNSRVVSLSAYAGRPVQLRFAYRSVGARFAGTGSSHGVFVDDISLGGAVELDNTATTSLGSPARGFSLGAATAGAPLTSGVTYYLRVRPRVGTRWFSDSLKMVKVVAGPDAEAPALSITRPRAGRVVTRALSHILQGRATDNVAATRVEFRVKAPGSTTKFGPWQSGKLSGQGRDRPWTAAVALPRAGVWQVQVRAVDAARNRSAVASRTIVVDRTRPTLKVVNPAKGAASTRQGRLRLSGTATDAVDLARVEVRVKRPGSGSAYGRWQTVGLTGTGKTRSWSYPVGLPVKGDWTVQVRSLDKASNASAVSEIKITHR